MEEKTSPAITTDSPPPSTSEQQSSRRRGGALKRKASHLNNNSSTPPQSSSSSSKRQTREKPSPVLFGPIHNGPLTRARLQPNYADPTGFWDAVIVNADSMVPATTPVSAKAEEELIARRLVWEALEAKIEAQFDELKSTDPNSHFVPICSGWFSWTKVHPLEERALPSFFNGKFENRTPEVYMEIRNSIMKRFHENPSTQIEEKVLSEVPVGELDAKKEVMEFLDYWGLINYHPFPEADVPNSTGEPQEAAKVNSLIQKLYEFEVEQLFSPAATRSSYTIPAVPSRLPESMITDESVQPEGPSVEYHCNSCAADCSRKRYHCQKQADYDLCTECFKEGKFDSDMAPSDFILMEPGDAAGANSGKWTDQETLLLLEALDLFSENWNEIAEHVATKTKAQCILHFIQMPIEDTFQDCNDEEDVASHKEKDEKKDASPDDNDTKKEIDGNLKENAEKVKEDVNMTEVDVLHSDTKGTEDPKALLNNDDDAPSNKDQPDSTLMEISEAVDINKLNNTNNNQENGLNIAVKALREAFDAVGSHPSVDEKLSFVDAGNPVMAMAAFLTRLVDPNIVTASTRTSLKSVSSGGTGLQLAARHSFVIEDPVDDKKKLDDTERDVEEVVEQEDLKEKSDSVNHHNKEEGKDVIINEKEKVSDSTEKKEDPVAAEVVVSKKGKNAGTKRKGSSKKDKVPANEKPVISAETNEQTKVENTTNSKKESEDSVDGVTPLEAPKDVEMAENSEPPQTIMPESTPSSGDAGAKECINVNKPSLDTKDDPNMHNLTRAAVSAISAAAVKAKLLADQEEDSIRQLATSLIEKQLHKLETKLAFFTEMDGVVTRAREQLERSKQRLYHERAQIIAARLGMSGNPTRPMQNPLPNRPGPTFANAVQRPPNAMNTPQRPPLSRPMIVAPTPVAGNSALIPNNQAMK